MARVTRLVGDSLARQLASYLLWVRAGGWWLSEGLGGRCGSMVVSSGRFCPQLEVAGQLGSLHLLLTPRQLQQLQELFSAMSLAGEASGRSRAWDTWSGGQPGWTDTQKRPPP